MVDSTVSPFAKEYQREQWLFALVFVSLYRNRGFSDEWIPSQANWLSVEVGLRQSLRGTDSLTCYRMQAENSLFSLSHWRMGFMPPRWGREMLKLGGKNGTSFLNSRKAKIELSVFYCWRVASKFQEMGGILDFVSRNSDSVGRKLFSFPCNFISFPCNFFFVRWNLYFLGRFFDYKPLFLHESKQFSSERKEIPKKNKPIFCENIKKLRNSKVLRIDFFRPTLLELQMVC